MATKWLSYGYTLIVDVYQIPKHDGGGDWSFKVSEKSTDDPPHPPQSGPPGASWDTEGNRWLGGGANLPSDFDRWAERVGREVATHLRDNRSKYEARPEDDD